MLSGRYTPVLRRTLAVNTVPQDDVCRLLRAQGSRCSLQQRPCSAGEYRSQRRLQKRGEADGTAGGGGARAASALGQGQERGSERPHRADPAVDSQECSRCLTPCGDKPDQGGAGEEAEESWDHRGASTSTSLHLYLPSPFYDEEGEKEKDQEDARHPTGLPQQPETMDTKTVPPAPSRTGPRHGVAKQKKSAVARAMPGLGQGGKLSAGSRNTVTPSSVPISAANSLDPAGDTPNPAPAPSPERPLQEEHRGAQVKGPPRCSASRRLVWRPPKEKDNYYQRAVLTKATDHFRLKTTTTLEWGLHGPQARKTVFTLQAHNSRPGSSLCRANASISGRGGLSRPSSTQSCVRTDV
ncbi:uncharacterized protein LOC118237339 isoform X2 [Anguilla anguilla]|uniref:uncharacterized protein LOC118237339 isoform X2 n=1 Tax=Anguilla anguilla TaxID=7936 RepID=UPI0015B1EF30|nr:uncharacterized protein LOC118237339 isoform X2 [Anguilla anguilla]